MYHKSCRSLLHGVLVPYRISERDKQFLSFVKRWVLHQINQNRIVPTLVQCVRTSAVDPINDVSSIMFFFSPHQACAGPAREGQVLVLPGAQAPLRDLKVAA
jgi:hypothetical protein